MLAIGLPMRRRGSLCCGDFGTVCATNEWTNLREGEGVEREIYEIRKMGRTRQDE